MKIVVLEPLFVKDEFLNTLFMPLKALGHEIIFYNDRNEDDSEIIKRAFDAEILVAGNLPLSSFVLKSLPKLKMLSIGFTGVDHIAMNVCKARNIVVCNASGYATDAVAELVIGFMIGIIRNILPSDNAVRNSLTRSGLVGSLLNKKTIGIIGLGAIGLRVIELLKPFNCKILGYSRQSKDLAGIEYTQLDDLMAQSDIISLHVPLTDQTNKLINEKRISLMKKTAYLINCARGAVVDNFALAKALNANKIAGAAIDVFETEPPINETHPLLNSKNTILAPHIAFASKESFEIRAEIVVENIIKWIDGKPQNLKGND